MADVVARRRYLAEVAVNVQVSAKGAESLLNRDSTSDLVEVNVLEGYTEEALEHVATLEGLIDGRDDGLAEMLGPVVEFLERVARGS